MQRYIKYNYWWTSSTSVYLIGLDVIYSIYNFCCTHLQCERAISTRLNYLIQYLRWGLVFLRRFIIDNDLVTDFVVVVHFYIIVNIIFIILCLFSWRNNYQFLMCLIGRIVLRPNIFWLRVWPFNLFSVDINVNAADDQIPIHGSNVST